MGFWDAKQFKQTLCGEHWVKSMATKNGTFRNSVGRISKQVCSTGRAGIERELIVRHTSTTADVPTCPNCGIFKKSGRASCCAPGGAWYKNCGGTGNNKLDHSWIEGVEACEFASTTTLASPVC